MDLAEVHVDAAGEGAAEGVVHDLHGIKVRGRAGDADAEGEERGLGGAGLVDDDERARVAGRGVRPAEEDALAASAGVLPDAR